MALLDDPAEFHRLLRLLRKNSAFATASPEDLSQLLSVATEVEAVANTTICTAGQTADSAFILLEGEFEIEGKLRTFGIGHLGGGIVGLGDALVPENPTYAVTLKVTQKGRYLSIGRGPLQMLRNSSAAFRQAIMAFTPAAPNADGFITPGCHDALGAVVQFVSFVPGLPLSLMIQLLAQEIVTRFPNDQVVILRPAVGGVAPGAEPVPGIPRLSIAFGLAGTMDELREGHDYVFLDGFNYGPPSLVVKLITGEPDQYQIPHAPDQPALLQTVVVVEGAPHKCGKDLIRIEADKMHNTTACAVRIRLNVQTLTALATNWMPSTSPVAISGPLKNSMYTWARAVTQRRTGIALSGGGVWSMQSIYTLRQLELKGVPLDVIAGPSAGAMIGAYYALKGLAGLDQIISEGDTGLLDVMAGMAMISPRLMDKYFRWALGKGHCLQSLDVQFLPSATDLTTGQGVAFVAGPLTLGVTAASSSVPIVPVTINGRHRFADGAYSNNVPVQVLTYYNASLTFGSNAFPTSKRPDCPVIPEWLLKLKSKGLLNRALDFTTAFNLLGSVAGATEGELASVSWNSQVPIDATYLITTNFLLSSTFEEMASNDAGLQEKIDDFASRWELLKNRGEPAVYP